MSRAPGELYLLFLGLALAALHGCVTPPERLTSAPVVSSARYECLNDLAKRQGARASWDETAGVFRAQLGDRQVAAAPGVAAALLGPRLVFLGDEVLVRYGRVYVPRWLARDIAAYLAGTWTPRPDRPDAVLPPPTPPTPPTPPVRPRTVGKVCIDPGHGGRDPGAISKWGLQEKEVVLATARLLKEELKSRGFDARLTRDGDTFIELEDRPAIASQTGCDVFVAVHANAIRDPSYRGLEIFYWYGSWSAASAASRREGVELAEAIKRAAEREGLTVRNMRGADYKVLRYAKVPATLVEIGFLTNRAEEQALRTRAYRRRVARAIAEGIDAYRKGK